MNRQISIETSLSGHNRCIVCKRRKEKDRPLKVVSQNSISHALVKHNILIPVGARACGRHFENGLIKEIDYLKISTHLEFVDARFIKSLKNSSKLNLNLKQEEDLKTIDVYQALFEPFRNLNTLSNDICLEITGWSKDVFVQFSKYIQNTRDTKNRSKGMLIAMSRYWLKKAVDQKTLSYLKMNSSQQQLSNELQQIREKIDRYFTPHWLGFSSKSRDFFIEHNTPTLIELYDLSNQPRRLCLFADGGYQTYEKSINNEVQADTFSVQKGKNLVKPFIITCADGYICDVYTDFEATKNDDKILRHILRTDNQLRRKLEKDDFFFLDRGFRDTMTLLRDDYGLNVVIPHCQQNDKKGVSKKKAGDEDNDADHEVEYDFDNISKPKGKNNPFTCSQSSEARKCTKVRSMVERVFAIIKKNKSLDFVRNSVLGHMGIDLRNACAMHNFTFRPTLYDKNHTEEVARRLRRRAEIFRTNHLEFILSPRLTTTHFFKRIRFAETDSLGFVKCKSAYLRRKIFCGSFQYKMAKRSYITDLLTQSKAYLFTPLKKFSKSYDLSTEIIAVKMPSRFKRGKSKKKQNEADIVDSYATTRRVYVQFTKHIPDDHPEKKRKCDYINGWICTCKNGRLQKTRL